MDTTTPSLIEMSFADVIDAIERSADFSSQKRAQWTCSLRRIAKALDAPVMLLPARWAGVRQRVQALHHATVQCRHKTLANHKTNVKAALTWFGGEAHSPKRGAPMGPEWEALRLSIASLRLRATTSSFMRYCSARSIPPAGVDEAVVDGWLDYRSATTALSADVGAHRQLARAWNSCVDTLAGWPIARLIEPPIERRDGGLGWDDFPVNLRLQLESYLASLTTIRRDSRGRRWHPCKESTITVRRNMLAAAVRRLVKIGVSLDELNSLSGLLARATVERLFNSYWDENNRAPPVFVIDLAGLLVDVARKAGCLSADELMSLCDMRALLEEDRPMGMTQKNRKLVRQIYHSDVWGRVVRLPEKLMADARRLHNQAPVKAAIIAQAAVAIAIETRAPIRLGNLGRIRVGAHLHRRINGNYFLSIPDFEVKNRRALEFWFDDDVSAVIAEYLHSFRAIRTHGFDTDALFPGEDGKPKGLQTLANQIRDCVFEATGLRVTVHQFRHAAGAVILKQQPGNFELVRLLLGHESVTITQRFYAELDSIAASAQFAKLVKAHGAFDVVGPGA